jgi:hypothetical protein
MRGGATHESSAKTRIAEVLRKHILDIFDGNTTRAAEHLGITKQRLNSYTSCTSFPGADLIDAIKEKWNLDLLNINGNGHAAIPMMAQVDRQLSLFDQPIKLANQGVEIVLARKGAGIAVAVTISPNLKRA